jgi:hypothetical protein
MGNSRAAVASAFCPFGCSTIRTGTGASLTRCPVEEVAWIACCTLVVCASGCV